MSDAACTEVGCTIGSRDQVIGKSNMLVCVTPHNLQRFTGAEMTAGGKSLPSTCYVLNCGVAGPDANDKSEAPGRAVCASNKTGPQSCLCQASALVPSRLPMPSERPGALRREAKPATAT